MPVRRREPVGVGDGGGREAVLGADVVRPVGVLGRGDFAVGVGAAGGEPVTGAEAPAGEGGHVGHRVEAPGAGCLPLELQETGASGLAVVDAEPMPFRCATDRDAGAQGLERLGAAAGVVPGVGFGWRECGVVEGDEGVVEIEPNAALGEDAQVPGPGRGEDDLAGQAQAPVAGAAADGVHLGGRAR